MKRILLIAVAVCATLAFVFAQSRSQSNPKQAARQQRHEERQQRRAQRLAEYEKYVDSLVLSRNFRFNPQTMQRQPAGMMRNLMNPNYELSVWDETVDVCLPFIKGYTPPYYPVVFNYVLPSVQGYTTEQTHDDWTVTFQTSLFSANTYTFSLEIYSRYGGATLTISSPFYNSVQYTGSIISI